MDKKDFILPGAILGLVIITTLTLLATHSPDPELIPSPSMASSTVVTATSTSSTTPGQPDSSPKPVQPPTSYYPYGRVSLSMSQAAGFKDGLSIRPVAVVEDSRCPTDVQCIQAGTVRVSLKLNAEGKESYQTIQLTKSIVVNGDTITLVEVSPSKVSTASPIQGSYHFVFTVTRGSTSPAGPCYVGGCSAQLCSDSPNAVSNCMYSPEYACYRTATCERQRSGACGWTQTAELTRCLANPPAVY